MWKKQLQEELADRMGLEVTVCHYPTCCSKYNPIEHRLFSFISINSSGKPFETFETLLSCIRGTITKAGLHVNAFLRKGVYETGERVSSKEMKALNLQSHSICPNWNYTIAPRLSLAGST